jgi:hypothetical protein
MLSSSDEEDAHPPTDIVTVDKMLLSVSLCMAYTPTYCIITCATRRTNMDRFNENYD